MGSAVGMHGLGWTSLRIFDGQERDLRGFGASFLIYMRTKGEYVLWINLWMKFLWEKVGNLGACRFRLYIVIVSA